MKIPDPSQVYVVILAGGKGARFDHESQVKPKPLIEVAGKPILGHIMDSFEAQGFERFIVLAGYLGDQIRDYVATRYECKAQVPGYDHVSAYGNKGCPVLTHVFDTGVEATTGDRLFALVKDMMPPGPHPFVLTYGDGLADVDLRALLEFHFRVREKGPSVTLTAVRPPGRFGILDIDETGERVGRFLEKSSEDWINGGFMVVDQGALLRWIPVDYEKSVQGPFESFETSALPRMAEAGRLFSYRHEGYWACMDTRRDLEEIPPEARAQLAFVWLEEVDDAINIDQRPGRVLGQGRC